MLNSRMRMFVYTISLLTIGAAVGRISRNIGNGLQRGCVRWMSRTRAYKLGVNYIVYAMTH